MAQTTLYDIRLRYQMEDRATRPMRAMSQQVERTAKSSRLLSSAWGKIGAAAGAYFGVRAGAKHLIGFNASMEQAKIQMAGMVSLTTKKGWTESMGEATALVDRLQERAKKSVGTTKDMVDMSSLIVRPISQAGLGMQDLEDLTAGAVVAARAFGMEADVAARDIESVLMGRVRSVDLFARALLEPMGMIGDKGREAFNAMSAQQRAMYLKSALTSEAITNMAKAQENSFSGVYSTFQDNLQIFLGKVGLPLFRALTGEIRSWNVWIHANADRVEEMSQKLAKGLASIFGLLRDVAGFFVNHADTLLLVAKGFAAYKLGTMAGGLVGQVGGLTGRLTRRAGAGLLMGNMNKAGLSVAKFGAGIATAAGAVAKYAGAVGVAYVAMKGLYDWWRSAENKRRAEERKRIQKGQEVMERVSVPKLGESIATYGAGMSELEKLAAKREAVGFFGARAGTPEHMKAFRAENEEQYLREVQLATTLGGKAGEIRGMYKQIAEYAQQTGLSPTNLAEFKASDFKGYAQQIATKEGVLEQEFAVQSIESALQRLNMEMANSTDRAGDFARMLQGTYLPSVLASAMETHRAAGQEGPSTALPPIGGAGKPPKINVTIHRIEAKSEDPDRFVFDLARTFEDVARTGSYRGGP